MTKKAKDDAASGERVLWYVCRRSSDGTISPRLNLAFKARDLALAYCTLHYLDMEQNAIRPFRLVPMEDNDD